jgi:hypothetical protein
MAFRKKTKPGPGKGHPRASKVKPEASFDSKDGRYYFPGEKDRSKLTTRSARKVA